MRQYQEGELKYTLRLYDDLKDIKNEYDPDYEVLLPPHDVITVNPAFRYRYPLTDQGSYEPNIRVLNAPRLGNFDIMTVPEVRTPREIGMQVYLAGASGRTFLILPQFRAEILQRHYQVTEWERYVQSLFNGRIYYSLDSLRILPLVYGRDSITQGRVYSLYEHFRVIQRSAKMNLPMVKLVQYPGLVEGPANHETNGHSLVPA
jgi:hypothetical protein